MEYRLDFERLLGFHVQQNDGALRVHGHKKSFAHGEGVAGIKNGGGFRPHGNGSGQSFSREDSAFGEEIQMKFPENLQRVDPCLHFAGFVSE